MNLTTPALLFPAISLLLAYTNRFSVLANLIRQLHAKHHHNLTDVALRQITNLRRRIDLVRYMQAMGVSSFLFCALSMLLLFIEMVLPAQYIFGLSIFLLLLSLLFSLYEVWISTKAIEIELEDIGQELISSIGRLAKADRADAVQGAARRPDRASEQAPQHSNAPPRPLSRRVSPRIAAGQRCAPCEYAPLFDASRALPPTVLGETQAFLSMK